MRFKHWMLLGLILVAKPGLAETNLKIVLLDDTVIQGTLLGSDSQVLSLEINGKNRDYPIDSIKKAYDATTGAPYALNADSAASEPAAVDSGEEAPMEPAQGAYELRPRRRMRRRSMPRQMQLRDEHEWFDLDFGWQVGAYTGANSSLEQFWAENAPSGANSYEDQGNHVSMALDFDALIRPLPWLAIGPFYTWNFLAPGADGSVTWSYPGYWSSYSNWTERDVMSLDNSAYGGRARIILPVKNAAGKEAGRFNLEVSYGQLELGDAYYKIWADDSLVYERDYSGTTPYLGLAAAFDGVLTRNVALSFGTGLQSAVMKKIHYSVPYDYTGLDTGNSGTETTSDGKNLSVDFSDVYFKFALIVLF
jgi:hypothetical protein